jgi:pimeloyl-ACP methyl ester carboxylesterase
MGFYRPFKYLRAIQIPTLVVGATRDTVAPFDEAKVRRMASDTVEIRTIDANHFDPYLEPWFAGNIKLQLDFANRIVVR